VVGIERNFLAGAVDAVVPARPAAYIIDETPAGRLGEPEDLTGTGIFLASAASDFITGTYIRPAGGSGVGDKAWPRP